MNTFIAFDGGYHTSYRAGAWAVVLVEDDHETLMMFDTMQAECNTDVEWYAAHMALMVARAKKVKVIKGDFKACIRKMSELYPEFEWVWIRSKSNPADKYAKYLPELT
jgi:ribonuclease HI